MMNIFSLKEIPFLLTILFGVLGYQINRISDTIINSPSVEYSIKVLSEEHSGNIINKEYVCIITNITSDKAFKRLGINFLSNDKNSFRIFNPKIEPIAPSSQHYESPQSLDSSILVYNISTLQPKDRYKLTFSTLANTADTETEPYLFLSAEENTIQIIEESFTTWFVRNSRLINVFLIILWVSMIFLYFILLSKSKKNENTSNN